MASLINIGMSGLNASQGALATVGNNIANANTSGYSRQQIVQGSGASQQVGGVFIGTGTTLADVRRVYNSYLDAQLQTTTSLNGDAQAYLDQIGTVDKLLSDKNTGVSAALSSFFSSLQTSAAAPGDMSARQLLLTSAQTLSNRFNSISSQLNQQNEGINSQLDTLTSMVNQHTATIASLNKQIAQATTAGNTPNNLLDARNEAVRTLNELVGVTVQEHDNVYDITLGTGQTLVQGSTSNTLSAVPGQVDKSQFSIQINYQQSSSDVTSVLSGGKIGGLLRYRDDVLAPAINDLGRTAIVVADAINKQLGQGLDANGEFGSSMFNNINSEKAITQRSLAATGNSAGSSNLNVSISDSSQLTAYDYKVTLTSATEYTVQRSDGQDAKGPFKLGDKQVIDGFTLQLPKDGAVAAGDTFKVSPTRSGASNIGVQMTDANKLAFAGPLVAGAGGSNSGTGAVGGLSLSSVLDIYGGVDLGKSQSDIEGAMPVRIAFDEAGADGTQTYRVLNEAGKEIGKGSIVPGQDNKVTINVPVTNADGTTTNVGFDTVISGSPGKGDSFDIKFNKDGKADNRNGNELLALQTKATVGVGKDGTGGVSMATSYSQLVSKVGGKASQAAVDGTANGAALAYAKEVRNSVSQVNLDEEASNLVKFQQYYTASSQIIKAAQATFSTLINSL
ncbi:flagellar hook-associated protein FlgK [Pseudomonas psychrophila]|uniref:Flagellar hook-associated protein 1 n=1 Tax=Pseudomonas psychrophila TaxID=122355 RepID=A0ABY0W2L1_9PSED|nr:flagellar hook-associated protein FlgK [Pseudomonas psychrophila]KAB0491401.1 flagellar hook-associated protein FlgK [Pseudomonas psychrophila]KMN00516.1 flagellar hook protein FlgK [Pseudomonas psychrophila]QIE34231.1 flagellar hook-associated protein FlgK [Pseudomonas psychrophila]WVI96328.1 flagellar hook-associated protein FlgK [Pseudomonas psychrophila]SDU70273.1 flagellar hook-associated protein 1 FlgK [Pseudomonas psychrophila]